MYICLQMPLKVYLIQNVIELISVNYWIPAKERDLNEIFEITKSKKMGNTVYNRSVQSFDWTANSHMTWFLDRFYYIQFILEWLETKKIN